MGAALTALIFPFLSVVVFLVPVTVPGEDNPSLAVRLHSLRYKAKRTKLVGTKIDKSTSCVLIPTPIMNNLSNRASDFFGNESESGNVLWQYVQSMNPETIAQLSKPSASAVQVIERNIAGMLGTLPPENFAVGITTSRENLGRLLASAMMSGYFLHNAEQRMAFEKSWQLLSETNPEADSSWEDESKDS